MIDDLVKGSHFSPGKRGAAFCNHTTPKKYFLWLRNLIAYYPVFLRGDLYF